LERFGTQAETGSSVGCGVEISRLTSIVSRSFGVLQVDDVWHVFARLLLIQTIKSVFVVFLFGLGGDPQSRRILIRGTVFEKACLCLVYHDFFRP